MRSALLLALLLPLILLCAVLLLAGCGSAPEWGCRNACYHKTGNSFACGCD